MDNRPGKDLTEEQVLSTSLISLQANGEYTEALMLLRDESRLCFRHNTAERWTSSRGESGIQGGSVRCQFWKWVR